MASHYQKYRYFDGKDNFDSEREKRILNRWTDRNTDDEFAQDSYQKIDQALVALNGDESQDGFRMTTGVFNGDEDRFGSFGTTGVFNGAENNYQTGYFETTEKHLLELTSEKVEESTPYIKDLFKPDSTNEYLSDFLGHRNEHGSNNTLYIVLVVVLCLLVLTAIVALIVYSKKKNSGSEDMKGVTVIGKEYNKNEKESTKDQKPTKR